MIATLLAQKGTKTPLFSSPFLPFKLTMKNRMQTLSFLPPSRKKQKQQGENCLFNTRFTNAILYDTLNSGGITVSILSDDIYLFSLDGRSTDLYIPNIGHSDFANPRAVPVRDVRTLTYPTLQIVLHGKGFLVIDGTTYPLAEGDLFYLPENYPLSYYPADNDPYEYVWFSFQGTQAHDLISRMGLSHQAPVCHASVFSSLRSSLEHLLRAVEENVGDPYYLALSAFYNCVHVCSRPSYGRSAAAARRIIDANYTSHDFSIERLCDTLHISHSHLCRLFKQAYSISAVRYLGDLRLAHACRLLKETDLAVKAVAFSCGFSDELHFMKRFKAELGMTARAYRQQHTS